MRCPLLILALCLLTFPVSAQPSALRYSEVTLSLEHDGLYELSTLGIALDHPIVERTETGWTVRVVLNEAELTRLRAGAVRYSVEVDDLAAAYAARPRSSPMPSPLRGFDYGSMGGYYTLSELEAELDAMRSEYPQLISERVSFGQSIEGRDLWVVRISDNPDVDEDEPEALYTALHHAREPQSMATVVYFMHYLLENYGVDDEVTELVDEVEFYFIPVLNPDGYVYNEETNPNGGGFWRKNRRDNGGNVFGVDLNRNYDYLWGLDDQGSSPFPEDQTYRGTAPFSEPEVAALRDFLEAREILTALNYHSRGEEYLYPWGYESGTYTEDDALYFDTSDEMAKDNGYEYGTGADVLYAVNGSSDDWMYGEQTTKPKILAWTPEVCNRTTDGFWPPLDRIIPIAQENVHANLTVARLARHLAAAVDAEESAPSNEQALTVYPNPARTVLTIEPPAGTERLVITDVLGRTVQETQSARSVDLAKLAPGLYFVAAITRAGERTVKPFTIAR